MCVNRVELSGIGQRSYLHVCRRNVVSVTDGQYFMYGCVRCKASVCVKGNFRQFFHVMLSVRVSANYCCDIFWNVL